MPVSGLKGHSIKTADAFSIPVCHDDHRICERFFTDASRIYAHLTPGLPVKWIGVSIFEIIAWILWQWDTGNPHEEFAL